tara:strand:- start:7073 stop:7456 length:384 start_codon:yes stop_codon:yes gene_type:complete
MDAYFNDYSNFRTDNYNMTDNSYSDNNRRMTDREADAYYEDYMERMEEAKKLDPDMVNNPDHYTHNGIEAIDVIEAKLTDEQFQGYLQGSVMKYLLRSNYKGKRNEDLKKAQWYLNCLVDGTDDSFE